MAILTLVGFRNVVLLSKFLCGLEAPCSHRYNLMSGIGAVGGQGVDEVVADLAGTCYSPPRTNTITLFCHI